MGLDEHFEMIIYSDIPATWNSQRAGTLSSKLKSKVDACRPTDMKWLKYTDWKYSEASQWDRKSGAFSRFPPRSPHLLLLHLRPVLFHSPWSFVSFTLSIFSLHLSLQCLLPGRLPDRLAFLNDRLSLWEASGYFREPWAHKYEAKKGQGKEEGRRGSGGVTREEGMKGGRKGARDRGERWERKGDLKRENKSFCFKWLFERAFYAPDMTPNYER